jgi:hypothetical protein
MIVQRMDGKVVGVFVYDCSAPGWIGCGRFDGGRLCVWAGWKRMSDFTGQHGNERQSVTFLHADPH